MLGKGMHLIDKSWIKRNLAVIRDLSRTNSLVFGRMAFFIYMLRKPRGNSFVFQGKTYEYFYHPYNFTWTNDRAIEIPIVWDIVKNYKGKRILEIGNVLSYYFPVNHEIVDKYERTQGVINCDILDFKSPHKYDLIISISTLEHIGWDEPEEREPMKTLNVIRKLKNMLLPGGKIIITFPVGCNPYLDKLFRDDKISFTKTYYMKRISKDNRWVETTWHDICNMNFESDRFFKHSNGLVIGIIEA
ncbi:class I SAM-dependent methyltransferase [Candidatus Micrarchaeota archaeon]|nr:class I SAM-dependent methyltransferase [Candidatus Micrarchaeota archaeon]